MFQTKSVEKVEKHILCSVTIFQNRAVCEMGGRTQMRLWRMRMRMRIACRVTKTTDITSEYVIIIALYTKVCKSAPRCCGIQSGAKRTHVFDMGISREHFFLWGYLKSKAYVRKPRTVDDLRVSIREDIATVPQEILVNVMQNFEERLRTCVRQEGRHISGIMFRN